MPHLPHLHLLCLHAPFADAWTDAVETHFPGLPDHVAVTVHRDMSLHALPPDLRFDAVVSPANSHGRLDGAFDDALSRTFGGPRRDYDWLTRRAQAVLYRRWKGFAPPGTCTVVGMGWEGEETEETGGKGEGNAWGVEYLLLCPTMRVPQTVRWDREVVYECVWSMLCAVDGHNRDLREGRGEGREIRSVLMTPLATGVGKVSARRWAEQAVLAIKHWVEAAEKPEVWGNLDWNTIEDRFDEVAATYEAEGSHK